MQLKNHGFRTILSAITSYSVLHMMKFDTIKVRKYSALVPLPELDFFLSLKSSTSALWNVTWSSLMLAIRRKSVNVDLH